MKLNFNGPATVVGFPRDKAFGFEIEGDVLILKAGKEVFLRVEKEPLIELVAETTNALQKLVDSVKDEPAPPHLVVAPEQQSIAQPVGEAEPEVEKTRKPRGPNIKIDDSALIKVDLNRANPYSKLRGKYYETLKTANGRPVSWWEGSTMVKSLEGNARTMLKFFLGENVVELIPPDAIPEVAASPQGLPGQQLVNPAFGPQGQFNQAQQAQVPGPAWTPNGGPIQPGHPPQGQGGATFL